MENLKFYHIEVGSYSRSGNLTVHTSFVGKSEQSRVKVEEHYRNQYNGFGVRVNEIKDILTPEINTNLEPDFGGGTIDKEKQEMAREIKSLKEGQFTRFKGTLRPDSLSDEAAVIYKELREQERLYDQLKSKMRKTIMEDLYKKYTPFCSHVDIDKNLDSKDVGYAEYTVVLKGKLQ